MILVKKMLKDFKRSIYCIHSIPQHLPFYITDLHLVVKVRNRNITAGKQRFSSFILIVLAFIPYHPLLCQLLAVCPQIILLALHLSRQKLEISSNIIKFYNDQLASIFLVIVLASSSCKKAILDGCITVVHTWLGLGWDGSDSAK